MGNHVAPCEQRENLLKKRRWFPDMDHQRKTCHICDVFGDPHRSNPPGTDNTAARSHLHPADNVPVGLNRLKCPLNVDNPRVEQLWNSVARDEAHRTDIDECPYGFRPAFDDMFSQTVKCRLSSGSGIGQHRNP